MLIEWSWSIKKSAVTQNLLWGKAPKHYIIDFWETGHATASTSERIIAFFCFKCGCHGFQNICSKVLLNPSASLYTYKIPWLLFSTYLHFLSVKLTHHHGKKTWETLLARLLKPCSRLKVSNLNRSRDNGGSHKYGKVLCPDLFAVEPGEPYSSCPYSTSALYRNSRKWNAWGLSHKASCASQCDVLSYLFSWSFCRICPLHLVC